jgi:predicted DNA binding CopG/RHH family protein
MPINRKGNAINANSSPFYDRLKDLDFEDAKRAHEVPHLARLQEEMAGKSRMTIRVNNRTLATFKAHAAMTDGNDQTLMNEVLAQFAQGQTLSDMARETLRATLQADDVQTSH